MYDEEGESAVRYILSQILFQKFHKPQGKIQVAYFSAKTHVFLNASHISYNGASASDVCRSEEIIHDLLFLAHAQAAQYH